MRWMTLLACSVAVVGMEVPGATQITTGEQLVSQVTAAGPNAVILIAGASWCGPCRLYQADLTQAPEGLRKRLLLLDAERTPELLKQLNIERLPTTIVLSAGTEPFQDSGPIPVRMLEAIVAKQERLSAEARKAEPAANNNADRATPIRVSSAAEIRER